MVFFWKEATDKEYHILEEKKKFWIKDIDYFESFAPTDSHITIRLVLAVTAIPGFFSYDYDAVCAFISAPLPVSERVYMKAVPGYPLEDAIG
jgi:hypothetical protein